MDGLLTVSMIVKNEERFLPACLTSIRDIADEIIVVDTGSTDLTVDIAKSFGARLIQIEWPDDFAKARNVGLDAVRTPWVLVLDADEEFIRDDLPALTAAIRTPIADAYNVRIVSVMDRAQDISESYVLRMFRSHPQVRFEGKVHEQIFQALKRENMTVGPLNVRLLHKGYLNAVVEGRSKNERNRMLLEKQLEQEPNDGYMLWQLAQTLMAEGKYSAAVTASRKALHNIPVQHPIWVLAQTTYAKLLHANGEPKRAIKALQNGQQAYPAYTDFYYLEGLFRMGLAQWAQAEQAFHKCVEIGEARGFLMTDTGVGGFKPLWKLSQVLIQQNRHKEALAYLLTAIKNNPPFRDGWGAIFALLAGSTFDAVLNTILLTVPLDVVITTISAWENRSDDEEKLLRTAQLRAQASQQS